MRSHVTHRCQSLAIVIPHTAATATSARRIHARATEPDRHAEGRRAMVRVRTVVVALFALAVLALLAVVVARRLSGSAARPR
jgi:hypothetical protein